MPLSRSSIPSVVAKRLSAWICASTVPNAAAVSAGAADLLVGGSPWVVGAAEGRQLRAAGRRICGWSCLNPGFDVAQALADLESLGLVTGIFMAERQYPIVILGLTPRGASWISSRTSASRSPRQSPRPR